MQSISKTVLLFSSAGTIYLSTGISYTPKFFHFFRTCRVLKLCCILTSHALPVSGDYDNFRSSPVQHFFNLRQLLVFARMTDNNCHMSVCGHGRMQPLYINFRVNTRQFPCMKKQGASVFRQINIHIIYIKINTRRICDQLSDPH